jgi:hypothetical protein
VIAAFERGKAAYRSFSMSFPLMMCVLFCVKKPLSFPPDKNVRVDDIIGIFGISIYIDNFVFC